MATEREPQAITQKCLEELEAEVHMHWAEEQASWDAKVEGQEAPSGDGLWDDLPCIDSKDVARMAPIFEKHLGVRFDAKHIRAGGYDDVNEVLEDLIPKLTGCEMPATFGANANGGTHDEQSTS